MINPILIDKEDKFVKDSNAKINLSIPVLLINVLLIKKHK